MASVPMGEPMPRWRGLLDEVALVGDGVGASEAEFEFDEGKIDHRSAFLRSLLSQQWSMQQKTKKPTTKTAAPASKRPVPSE